MIRLLIVDDDTNKRAKILAQIQRALGLIRFDYDEAITVNQAATYLESKSYDLMILDINLPLKDGDAPRKDGGLKLLKQLIKNALRFRQPDHILGLTAYEDLQVEFNKEFDGEGWQLLHYNAASSDWEEKLGNKVAHIAANRKVRDAYQYDLAIVTALKETELEAVLNLPANWKRLDLTGDDTIYYEGVFEAENTKIRVVAAASLEMGMSAATALTTKMIMQFKPKYLAMAGIAAGVKADYGDVVVAERAWDYGSGKIKQVESEVPEFSPAPNQIAIDTSTKEELEHFILTQKDKIVTISQKWAHNEVAKPLSVKIGPVASGAAVLESQEKIDEILEGNRKLAAVEMETYGVYTAVRSAPAPKPCFFSAKSVCDFGIHPKTDDFQKYAAFTSAHFIYEFICSIFSTKK